MFRDHQTEADRRVAELRACERDVEIFRLSTLADSEAPVPEADRQADLTVRIRGYYQAPRGCVARDMAIAEVVGNCDGLGLRAGEEVVVQMLAHAADGNLIVHDLIAGDSRSGTPECRPGSVVTFEGCSRSGGTELVQASSFQVVESVSLVTLPGPGGR